MRKRICHLVIGMLVSLVVALKSHADDVVRYIPSNALGYFVGQDLQVTSDKIQQLAKPLGFPIASPLELLRATIGLHEGLDASGNVAIALLADASDKQEMHPLVLLPISSYEAFALSIQADPSGEICRVAILGEDVLVARLDEYAIFVNVENQSTMQRLLDRQTDPELDRETDSTAIESPTGTWTAEQDIFAVLLPLGMKKFGDWKPQKEKKYIFSEEDMQQSMMLSSNIAALFGPELREWFAKNVKLAAVGIAIDDLGNLQVSSQVALRQSSPLARFRPTAPKDKTINLGLVNEQYVISAGGPLPIGWGQGLAELWYQMEKSSATASGLEKLTAEDWEKTAAAKRLLVEDVQSCSFVMLPGKKGEPLVGNFLGLATLPDVEAYLSSLGQVVDTWNEINELSTSDLKPESELVTQTVENRIRTEIVVDYASAMRDENVPAINWMLESAFGIEGKLRLKFLQVDDTRCLFGLATDEQMSAALDKIENGNIEIPEAPDHSAALQLLDGNAPWKALVQPQSCLTWAARFENEFIGILMLSPQEIVYPAMADSPPIGLSLSYRDDRWQVEIACPAETWRVMGQYILNYDELE